MNSSDLKKVRAIFYRKERARLQRRLEIIGEKLPLGILTRLVNDAEFYYEWFLGKRKARNKSKLTQKELAKTKATIEAKFWTIEDYDG